MNDLLRACAAAVTADINWMIAPSVKVSGHGRSYNSGTKTLTLCRGDTASFHWSGGLFHDVVHVSAANWNACNFAGARPVVGATNNGSKKIKFSAAGLSSYACSVSNHCSLGQKLKIRVKSKC